MRTERKTSCHGNRSCGNKMPIALPHGEFMNVGAHWLLRVTTLPANGPNTTESGGGVPSGMHFGSNKRSL